MNPNAELTRGFADPTFESQYVFRTVLQAMAEPGRVETLRSSAEPPKGLDSSAAAVILTLVDFETPIWLSERNSAAWARWMTFHTGAPIVSDPRRARFALLSRDQPWPDLKEFDPGEDRYPDRSATLLVLCDALVGGPSMRLTGPGIETHREIAPRGLPNAFWDDVAQNTARFPLGFDMILIAGSELAGLPRTTHAEPNKGVR